MIRVQVFELLGLWRASGPPDDKLEDWESNDIAPLDRKCDAKPFAQLSINHIRNSLVLSATRTSYSRVENPIRIYQAKKLLH